MQLVWSLAVLCSCFAQMAPVQQSPDHKLILRAWAHREDERIHLCLGKRVPQSAAPQPPAAPAPPAAVAR